MKDNWICFDPIGIVHSKVRTKMPPDFFMNKVSVIEVFQKYEDAIQGLEHEEFITVLFYFHQSVKYEMKVHPRGDMSRPLKGVFATCSPERPNFIGVSKCKLLNVKGRFLAVNGLDAIDGTPVMDIKPFRF